MAKHDRISVNPAVMVGKPVIRGPRITVELIMYKLSSGLTEGEFLTAYPHLTHEDIQAARAYAWDTSTDRAPVPERTPVRMLSRRRMPSHKA